MTSTRRVDVTEVVFTVQDNGAGMPNGSGLTDRFGPQRSIGPQSVGRLEGSGHRRYGAQNVAIQSVAHAAKSGETTGDGDGHQRKDERILDEALTTFAAAPSSVDYIEHHSAFLSQFASLASVRLRQAGGHSPIW